MSASMRYVFSMRGRFDKVAEIKDDHVLRARRELHEMAHSDGDGADHGMPRPFDVRTRRGTLLMHGTADNCGYDHGSGRTTGSSRRVDANAVADRPGDAPEGTLHVVELHEQLKNIIEK